MRQFIIGFILGSLLSGSAAWALTGLMLADYRSHELEINPNGTINLILE